MGPDTTGASLDAPGRGRAMRHLAAVAGLVLAAVPLGLMLTFLLLPLWRWLEARHHIESIGHSGPAQWCYLATVLACVAASVSAYAIGAARRSGRRERAGTARSPLS